MHKTKLIAFDLDGTLSQHRSHPPAESFALLDELSASYQLVMVGAGAYERIHRQLKNYPIDIIGNYGMQRAAYNKANASLDLIESFTAPVDKEASIKKADLLRDKFSWHHYTGDTIEFHAGGMMTLPLLGTKAAIEDKLSIDPTRVIRLAALEEVRQQFCDYTVFVGGSSSFDIVPKPFCKLHALQGYASSKAISPDEILYVGDDYHPGGNDEDVYASGLPFVCVDDYRHVGHLVRKAL